MTIGTAPLSTEVTCQEIHSLVLFLDGKVWPNARERG